MAASFVPKRLYSAAVGTSTPGSNAYTAPANTAAQIRAIQFTNTGSSAINATCWVVPSGGSIGASTLYLNAVPIPPSTDDPDSRTLVLNAGDGLAFQASASGLNVCVSGAEEVLS